MNLIVLGTNPGLSVLLTRNYKPFIHKQLFKEVIFSVVVETILGKWWWKLSSNTSIASQHQPGESWMVQFHCILSQPRLASLQKLLKLIQNHATTTAADWDFMSQGYSLFAPYRNICSLRTLETLQLMSSRRCLVRSKLRSLCGLRY